jgi:hypothetical protein
MIVSLQQKVISIEIESQFNSHMTSNITESRIEQALAKFRGQINFFSEIGSQQQFSVESNDPQSTKFSSK